MRALLRTVAWVWASPYTALGLSLGLIGVFSGGGVQVRRGVLEFHGGATAWLLCRLLFGGRILAMTLGHSILGQSSVALDLARDHEHVHVRQFERWGPLMGPAYLLASLWVWLNGKRAYRDNPFEVAAYEQESIGPCNQSP